MSDTELAVGVSVPDKYKLLNDAYYGEGGFDDGTYIIKHSRETVENYAARKVIAYFLNYLEPIVNSHVDPVYKKEAERSTKNTLFEKFLEDVDASGTQMHDYIKQASLECKLNQVNFIVVDNFNQQPENLQQVFDQRAFPFCYNISPERVTNYKIDKFGRLVEITYTETNPDDPKEMYYKTWNEMEWKLWKKGKEGVEVVVSAGQHNLGILPVVPYFPRKEKKGVYKPMPQMYGLAKINRRIFNLTSEIDEALRGQTFNVLIYPTKDGIKNLAIGVNNALTFDPESKNKPDFIAPDPEPINKQIEYLAKLILEMYRQAQLGFATGTQESKSGVAKAWDFENTNQSLIDLADNAQKTEERIAFIFGKWIKAEVDYTVVYPENFGIVDVQGTLAEVTDALDLGVGGKFDEEIKKRLARVLFAADKDLQEEIVADIEAILDDENLSEDKTNDDDDGE